DWPSVSRWYSELALGRAEVTPALEQALRLALPPSGASPPDALLAAGMMVRDRVRYVAVELGLAGYQPRPAAETLAKLYGDCKDKGTLLQSALAVEKFSSYPVLVHSGGAETIPQDPPLWGFNHLIVAVTIPTAQSLPDRFAPAQVTDADLGRLLLIDPTSDTTSIGWLPAGLAGQTALVAAGDRGKLITLPGRDSDHQIQEHWIVKPTQDGNLHLMRETRLTGELAAEARSDESRSSRDRRRSVEEEIARWWPDAVVEEYSVRAETAEGEFLETVSFHHGFSRAPGDAPDSGVEVFPGAGDMFERVPLGRRKGAVEYGFPRLVLQEIVLEGFPEGEFLPAAQSLQGNGWAITTSYTREQTTLRARWEARLSRRRFEVAEFPELRKFWSSLSSSASLRVRLSR
ncbi:MAG TPA: hypothetical protein VKL61_07365, partial [Candidatus Polarisedimenticolia bacterium]|nr:hypothetical protein [Candidatus Polarisedimenticolia bacterium]